MKASARAALHGRQRKQFLLTGAIVAHTAHHSPPPSENAVRYNVLGNAYSLSVTPYTGNFPAGLQLVPYRRSDSVVVAPSWQAIVGGGLGAAIPPGWLPHLSAI